MDDEIYKENILDHYKNPHNSGALKKYTFKHRETNPLCGDEIEMFVKIDKSRITDVAFIGKGCAISQASASMLTDLIKGRKIEEIKRMTKEDVLKMLGINIGIVRMKCALLPLKAMIKGIEEL